MIVNKACDIADLDYKLGAVYIIGSNEKLKNGEQPVV